MKNKSYWCPRCGRMFMREAAFRKHVNAKKCTEEGEMTGKEHDTLSHFGQGRSLTVRGFVEECFNTPGHRYLVASNEDDGTTVGKFNSLTARRLLARLERKGWLLKSVQKQNGPCSGCHECVSYSLTTKGAQDACDWEKAEIKKHFK